MTKRLILALFSVCVIAHGLHGMKPKTDWNKKLFDEIAKGDIEEVRNCLKNGADVDKVNDKKETPLFRSIFALKSACDNSGKKFSDDIFKNKNNSLNALYSISNPEFSKDENDKTIYNKLIYRLEIVRSLLEHGATIDAESKNIAKDFLIKNQTGFFANALDRYMRIAFGYMTQKDSESKFNYVNNRFKRKIDYNGSSWPKLISQSSLQPFLGTNTEDHFLARVCFGDSLREVNLNKSKRIEDTTFYKLDTQTIYKSIGSFEGPEGDPKGIKEIAKALHYYLRPDFFNPVKTVVKPSPVRKPVPTTSKSVKELEDEALEKEESNFEKLNKGVEPSQEQMIEMTKKAFRTKELHEAVAKKLNKNPKDIQKFYNAVSELAEVSIKLFDANPENNIFRQNSFLKSFFS